MRTTTIRVKGGHFTGFIYSVLHRHISYRINLQSFYQIRQKRGNSAAVSKFHGSAQNSAACRKRGR